MSLEIFAVANAWSVRATLKVAKTLFEGFVVAQSLYGGSGIELQASPSSSVGRALDF